MSDKNLTETARMEEIANIISQQPTQTITDFIYILLKNCGPDKAIEILTRLEAFQYREIANDLRKSALASLSTKEIQE